MTAVEIGIHAYLVPSHLAETTYIGVLFVVGSVLLVGVMVSLLTGLARLVAWPLGLASPATREVVFVACALYAVRFRRAPATASYPVEMHGIYDAETLKTRQAAAAQARRASTDTAGMR